MPRRNDREHRGDPREVEFWRSLNCSDDDPCYSRKKKSAKKVKRKGKANGGSSE